MCKVCRIGGQEKALTEFHRATDMRDGQQHAEHQRRVRAKPGFARRMRASHLKRTYGITLSDYEAMLAAQGGGAICADPPPDGQSLHVDHDHDTGLVGGLLCFNGNAGLGKFGENIDLLSAAVVYLRR